MIRLAHLLRRQEMPRRFGSVGKVHVLPLEHRTQSLVMRQSSQAICGTHRVRTTYTKRMRTLLGHDSTMPQMGERVICRRNQKDEGLFNGMIGSLTRPAAEAQGRDAGLWSLGVQMEDEVRSRSKLIVHPWMFQAHYTEGMVQPRVGKDIQLYDWAWLITCHASQGSEFPSVTVVDDWPPSGSIAGAGSTPPSPARARNWFCCCAMPTSAGHGRCLNSMTACRPDP